MIKTSISILTGLLVISFASCKFSGPDPDRVAIARAGESVLYYDELPGLIYPGMSETDSIAVVQNYINKWAKREILKIRAIENLTPGFRNEVEAQLDEIRTNLLIHHYQQQMIGQKLDTIIAEEEIENYYASSSSTFVLNNNIIRALFIKVPAGVPDSERVPVLLRSDDQNSLAQLELWCYQFADKFDDFNEEWIPFPVLLTELPGIIPDQEEFLRRNTYYETSDSLFHYYVRIRDYKLRGTVAPYEYARNNILSIILNNRKMDFIQDLENGIFNEAIKGDLFKIYQ